MAEAGIAFLFVSPGANPDEQRAVISVPGGLALLVVGAEDYQQAAEVAKKLVADGIKAIELCAGFGHKGAAIIAEATEGKIPIGVVRFDDHPALNHKSGDSVF